LLRTGARGSVGRRSGSSFADVGWPSRNSDGGKGRRSRDRRLVRTHCPARVELISRLRVVTIGRDLVRPGGVNAAACRRSGRCGSGGRHSLPRDRRVYIQRDDGGAHRAKASCGGNIGDHAGRAGLSAALPPVGHSQRSSEDVRTYEEMVDRASARALSEEFARPTDLIVVVAGIPFAQAGTTNNLRVVQVGGP
jgi:Pyruvate kinase, alpha/beta domain